MFAYMFLANDMALMISWCLPRIQLMLVASLFSKTLSTASLSVTKWLLVAKCMVLCKDCRWNTLHLNCIHNLWSKSVEKSGSLQRMITILEQIQSIIFLSILSLMRKLKVIYGCVEFLTLSFHLMQKIIICIGWKFDVAMFHLPQSNLYQIIKVNYD